MHNFKAINKFSPNIFCENVVEVKNKISNWDQTELGIKNIAKML